MPRGAAKVTSWEAVSARPAVTRIPMMVVRLATGIYDCKYIHNAIDCAIIGSIVMTQIAKSYKDCQSCGMPMRRDEKGGGTNADGSKNLMYCSHCYEAGAFTLPKISAGEMRARVKSKLREVGVPRVAAWFLARRVPKLARWKSN
jgi:hypothetical protein